MTTANGLCTDLTREVALAADWFAHLRERSRTRLGVTRASYGDGEQMAHDLIDRIGAELQLER